MGKKTQEGFSYWLNVVLQYIFCCKGYTGQWITSVFAVYAAYEYTKAVSLFVAVLELIMVFEKSTATVRLTIRFQHTATLMSLAGKFIGFFWEIYPYTSTAKHQAYQG